MRILLFFTLLLVIGCTPRKLSRVNTPDQRLQALIEQVKSRWSPDRRTSLFEIKASDGILKGETTLLHAKAALLQLLDASGLAYTDSIVVLPADPLLARHALVTISVANLRTQPHHRAEMATQATMGTWVRVWKKERGWYLVQTPDEYLAWMDGDALQTMDAPSLSAWQGSPKLIYTDAFGFLYGEAGATLSDLVFGDIMVLLDSSEMFFRVQLPDGRRGLVPASSARRYTQWVAERVPRPDSIVAAAKKLMGVPYLWGGTSFKGVDCSGFTKTAYFMNGMVLPRDASQQAELGVEIDTSQQWRLLQPGDLLFFGSRASGEKPELVTHVGIWLGEGEFIHASGMVRVASLRPGALNYDAGEHRRFLKAKRMTGDARVTRLNQVPAG